MDLLSVLNRVFDKITTDFCNVLATIEINTAQWKVVSMKVDQNGDQSELTVDFLNTITNYRIKLIERVNSQTKERWAYVYDLPLNGTSQTYVVQTCGELLSTLSTLFRRNTTAVTG